MEASWLWPDHVIGKRESRRLRDEHNALVNRVDNLARALSELLTENDQLARIKADAVLKISNEEEAKTVVE